MIPGNFASLTKGIAMNRTVFPTPLATLAALATLVAFTLNGCSDYTLQEGVQEELNLKDFRDCTNVVADHYWYSDHEFGVVMIYDACLAAQYKAYLLIEHESDIMEGEPVQIEYETSNGDTFAVDAWKFTFDLWYNPVDIELTVIPYQDRMAFGLHEFTLNCLDDDQQECALEYMGAVGASDFE